MVIGLLRRVARAGRREHGRHLLSADFVADAAYGADQRAAITGIHFAAEIIDVDVRDVGLGVEVEFRARCCIA